MQDKQTWTDIYSTTINNNIYFREIDRYYYIINIISNYLNKRRITTIMMKIFIFAMLVTTIAASTTKPSIDVLNGKSYLDVFIGKLEN